MDGQIDRRNVMKLIDALRNFANTSKNEEACTGLSKKMDGILNCYNLKSIERIYTIGVLKCSENFKVLDLTLVQL